MKWIDAAGVRLRLLFARRAAEERMDEEFRFHVDMETERLVREDHLAPAEARRRALVAFGGTDRYGEELREGRGLGWLSGLSLDLRLGLRILVKYPGLTLAGGLGMAVAIGIAAVSFGIVYAMLDPALPLDAGDRVVLLQNLDARGGNPARGSHLHDLEVWRDQLASVEDLGAFRTVQRNLLDGDGNADLVRVAEMTASGFTLARVPPLLGRPLLETDERPDAGDVVVIGEDVWRSRFAADPGIVGRTVRLGTTSYVIVGVMPAGFRFPVSHQYWVPLRLDAADYARGVAPSVDVFGRLAAGAGIDRARADVATIARRLQATYPDVYEHTRAQVMPYTYPFFDIDTPAVAWAFHLIQVLVTLLLVVVSVNVAILNYARTATRAGEITVRTALGASRRRVVAQLFAEAFVLSAVAAAVGLSVAAFALGWLTRLMQQAAGDEIPFWFEPRLSAGMALYIAALAVLGGVIVGVVPALKATGPRIQAGLRSLGSGGSSMQLGGTWTALVVTQVALAVAILPPAVDNAIRSARYGTGDPGYPADEFVRTWADMEHRLETVAAAERNAYERAFGTRYDQEVTALIRRLESDPAVAAATFAQHAPGEEWATRVTVDGVQHIVRYNRVDVAFFDVFDVPLLTGRGFAPGDAGPGSTGVVVNRSFARLLADPDAALGRVVRYAGSGGSPVPGMDADAAFAIIGVVEDFPNAPHGVAAEPRIYHATSAGMTYPVLLAVRVRGGDAAAFARRMRNVAVAASPLLQLYQPTVMADADREEQSVQRLIAAAVLALTLSVILLSAAGIYAMMSFTVARRRREIGIRAALGAPPAQLLRAVFSRAAKQLTAGVAIGIVLAAALDLVLQMGYSELLTPVAALMLAIGMLAASGPARRGLRIPPTQALRED